MRISSMKTTDVNHVSTSTTQHKKTKWAIFTYHGLDTRTITELFRYTNLKIAYKPTNSMKHHLKLKNQITDMYSKSGVYQLNCDESPMKYIGQTGRLKPALKNISNI
jgi:hypothetical protein